jgi:hypothetical protein
MNQITLVAGVGERGAFRIFDPLGRSYTVPQNGNALDVSSLQAGIYYVAIGGSVAKFVKE